MCFSVFNLYLWDYQQTCVFILILYVTLYAEISNSDIYLYLSFFNSNLVISLMSTLEGFAQGVQ